jgi:hypothetical protein
MSAKTIVAASKVDDALHKVAVCAETLVDKATDSTKTKPSWRVSNTNMMALSKAIDELKEAEEAFKTLLASENA